MLLDLMYQIFDAHVETQYQVACQRGCALCCTQHVTLTTLEACRIFEHLRRLKDKFNENRFIAKSPSYFRPRYTINEIAYACINHLEPPEEEPGPVLCRCPLLEYDQCAVYDSRPFICRAFLSLHPCQFGGRAEVPSALASIIGICQQIIEHLDTGGYFGNLTDILAMLVAGDNAHLYLHDEFGMKIELPTNRSFPGFLIPPEDSAEVNAFLSKLFCKHVNGMTYLQMLNRIRPMPVESFQRQTFA
jgi:Fe-S-cluster containining protein